MYVVWATPLTSVSHLNSCPRANMSFRPPVNELCSVCWSVFCPTCFCQGNRIHPPNNTPLAIIKPVIFSADIFPPLFQANLQQFILFCFGMQPPPASMYSFAALLNFYYDQRVTPQLLSPAPPQAPPVQAPLPPL